jgi:hypothetical protein
MAVWYSFWSFGIFSYLACLDHEKSGNPVSSRFPTPVLLQMATLHPASGSVYEFSSQLIVAILHLAED